MMTFTFAGVICRGRVKLINSLGFLIGFLLFLSSLMMKRWMYSWNEVCFFFAPFLRNIEELQEKNQQLLEAIRDLSTQKEQEESLATDARWECYSYLEKIAF